VNTDSFLPFWSQWRTRGVVLVNPSREQNTPEREEGKNPKKKEAMR